MNTSVAPVVTWACPAPSRASHWRAARVAIPARAPAGTAGARHDGYGIRAAAVNVGVPLITTVQGVAAAVQGTEALQRGGLGVRALQDPDHSPKHAAYVAAKTAAEDSMGKGE